MIKTRLLPLLLFTTMGISVFGQMGGFDFSDFQDEFDIDSLTENLGFDIGDSINVDPSTFTDIANTFIGDQFDNQDQSTIEDITNITLSTDNSISEDFSMGNAYPNPAITYTNIPYSLGFNQPADLILMSITGKVVKRYTIEGSGSQRIDISDLPQGIYFYAVQSANGISQSAKLIRK